MPIDVQLLQRHRRWEDHAAGIAEEFLQPELPGGSTVAVLARPLGPTEPVAWVLCHPFASEQANLADVEIVTARSLAAAGFPVLRYHGRGYGDADPPHHPASLTSHLEDATAAVATVREVAGTETVGVIGARLGGSVAAIVAEEGGLGLLGMWEPVVDGRRYMRDFLRAQAYRELAGGTAPVGAVSSRLRRDLERDGWTDVRGFRLTADAYSEITTLRLVERLRTFAGAALLLSLSRRRSVDEGTAELARRLRGNLASVEERVLEDRGALRFGHHHHQAMSDTKIDTQFETARAIAAATVAWARTAAGRVATGGNGRR